MIKLVLCVAAVLKLASAQFNGIIWDVQPQFQPQYNQPAYPQFQSDDKNREAADEPVVGSPLLPIIPPILPFGVPGLRFSNFNAGRFGGLLHGHALLGAPNPMADDQAEAQYQPNAEQQISSQYQASEYQVDPQISAQQDPANFGHGGHWWWKKWANDDQSGSMVGASPCSCAQSYQTPQVSSPQSYSGYESVPQYNQEYQISSPQSYEVAAPQNYPAYPQPAYSSYQSQLPQIISEYQPNQAQEHRAQIDYQQVQPQSAGPIIQPAGTYESSSSEKSAADSNADERSWDWSWKE
jgi:hypothetical protein